MPQVVPVELSDAVGEVAAVFDAAKVGREIGVIATGTVPPLASQPGDEAEDETVLAATSNVSAIIDGLADGVDPADVPVPTVSLRWADWMVARGIDQSAILWSYNLGNGRMAEALREVVSDLDLSGEQRLTLSDGLTRYVQRYVESISAQLVGHHGRACERWNSGADAYRRSVVQRLVAGEPVDIRAASRELGYELDAPHLAAIVWSPTDELGSRPTPRSLQDAAAEVLRACGAGDVLTIPTADGSAWAWGQGRSITDTIPDRVLDQPGMLGAIGTVSSGARGFVTTHLDAQRAKRMAGIMARQAGSITPYRSVALASLVAQDPEQALRFIESELGSLTENSDPARRLRATLSVYLEEGMRPVRAARRLGVHQNTVAYRLTQAELAIGRPLGDRRLELETALRLAESLESLRSSVNP